MERLTLTDKPELKPWVGRKEAINRLRAYEDSGLEPEEILEMKEIRSGMQGNEYIVLDDRLKRLLRADGEDRLVVLPCKTGDTIYQLRGKHHAQGVGISPRIVSCAHVWSNGDYTLSHQGMTVCRKKDLGKTWFLAREEAEAALEAQKGDSHDIAKGSETG